MSSNVNWLELPSPSESVSVHVEPATGVTADGRRSGRYSPSRYSADAAPAFGARYTASGADPFTSSLRALESLTAPDGYELEFEFARECGRRSLDALLGYGCIPTSIVATPEGGVALYFSHRELLQAEAPRRRHARVECSVDGASVLLQDRIAGWVDAWDMDDDNAPELWNAAARICGFLQG